MRLASPRSLFLLAFIGSALLIVVALYMEHVMGLAPCPLCIVQRICVIAFGLTCLLAAIHGPAKPGGAFTLVSACCSYCSAAPLPFARSGCRVCRPISCRAACQAWNT